ncbi:MAG: DUF4190 domain-containing protein [Phycisphaerales bacterium]
MSTNPYEPQPSAPPPPPVMTGGPSPVPQTSGKAVASMVLGIVSCITFCLCYGVISIPCAILAIVFSGQAMADATAGRSGRGGDGMAKAGKICGIVGLCLTIVYIVVIVCFIVFAVSTGAAAGSSGTGRFP